MSSLRLNKIARTALLATTAAVMMAGTAATGSAEAAVHPTASCTVLNVSDPADNYQYGTYTGQVEQQFESCNGVDYARAHYQWASSYLPTAVKDKGFVNLYVESYPTGSPGNGQVTAYATANEQDAWSNWVDIHSVSPDTWVAIAVVVGAPKSPCGYAAITDAHVYSTGGTTGPVLLGGCNAAGTPYWSDTIL